MDDNSEILTEFVLRVYKDGHVPRLVGTDTLPAGLAPPRGHLQRRRHQLRRLRPPLPPQNRDTPQKLPILVYIHGGGFMIESPSPFLPPHLNSLVSQANIVAPLRPFGLAPSTASPPPTTTPGPLSSGPSLPTRIRG
ncbi:uncharacterized protein A4U43_C08F22630 [Asparagus officinalis]|nr:uncharacterized protein A4U43_C08F22630 [Asparagus officinalis]